MSNRRHDIIIDRPPYKRESPSIEEEAKITNKRSALGDITNRPSSFHPIKIKPTNSAAVVVAVSTFEDIQKMDLNNNNNNNNSNNHQNNNGVTLLQENLQENNNNNNGRPSPKHIGHTEQVNSNSVIGLQQQPHQTQPQQQQQQQKQSLLQITSSTVISHKGVFSVGATAVTAKPNHQPSQPPKLTLVNSVITQDSNNNNNNNKTSLLASTERIHNNSNNNNNNNSFQNNNVRSEVVQPSRSTNNNYNLTPQNNNSNNNNNRNNNNTNNIVVNPFLNNNNNNNNATVINNNNSNSDNQINRNNNNIVFGNQIIVDRQTEFQMTMAHHIWGDWSSFYQYDIDMEVDGDPVYCTEYIHDIQDNMRKNQIKTQPRDYMPFQPDIKPNMRSILVDWIVDIAFDIRIKNETIFLAINYLDRYCSAVKVKKDQFQMIGAASFLIACKYEEVHAPTPHEVISLAGNYFSIDQLFEAESLILKAIDFRLTAPTVKFFLSRHLRAATTADPRVSALSHFYGELSLMDYNLVAYLPSFVAAACVYLAMITTNHPWTSTLSFYTRVLPDDPFFKNVVRLLWNLHRSESTLSTIKNKYKDHLGDIRPLPVIP
ncbi:cyclin [Heterostelium album PN500]|uniref:Cyclin n=1 Tax=Heterostelium pallidum (strain ATCC 26659 / Pp 5 / PN500) TaxID=670386 RepID=D3BCL6_HETP5|nr:cyclin [Heterostelium album PN500]EFA80658.1 cyclin [Heterostelium album PN500]|eukprot:XP_020432778.1 cyclin [Heterostelium album PN500]